MLQGKLVLKVALGLFWVSAACPRLSSPLNRWRTHSNVVSGSVKVDCKSATWTPRTDGQACLGLTDRRAISVFAGFRETHAWSCWNLAVP